MTDTPQHMTIALRAHADRDRASLDEMPVPEPGPGEVRLEVRAASVNPIDIDIDIVSGGVRAAVDLPDPIGLGWDVSGTVAATGEGVIDLALGDRVAGTLHVIDRKPAVGTHATSTVLPAAAVVTVPDHIDLVDAASVPLNALTAWQALDMLGAPEGRNLLITGAAGAVGGYAIALAAERGWRVTGLARPGDAAYVRGAGAELVTDIVPRSFDAAIDAAVMLGAAIEAVRDHGDFIGVAPPTPVAPVRGIRAKTVLFSPDREQLTKVFLRVADGRLQTRIAGRVALRDAERAYDAVAAGGHRGRWLLMP